MKSLVLICIAVLSCAAIQASPPTVHAGNFQAIYLPANTTQLNGSATDADGPIVSFLWTKISGPSSFNIMNATAATTSLSDLVAGEYHFVLQATDAQGETGRDTVQIMVYATANLEVASAGNYPNLVGANPGYYGGPWNDMQVYNAMANAGCRSTRSTIPMFFFGAYGDSVRYAEASYYYNTLGFRENVFFLYNDATAPFPDRSTEVFSGGQAVVPAGLYLPIWNADGSVNMNNSFARYCYKVVRVYGNFHKYYEIWNEPDFTNNWSIASALPGTPGNWWENDPDPADMLNTRAPIQYYIRMLRIAYEVIKRHKPDAVITLGGLGYPSFMHALLRNTDNPMPDAGGRPGSVTAEFPLKAGAYFDGLSFHSYPQYFLKFWDYTTNAMGYKRHSDEAIDQTIRDKESYQQILRTFGYGSTYPDKPVICTEINIPRKALNQEIGGIEVQRNFAWKAVAKAARNNISQMYWYVTGEVIDYNSATTYDAFKMMGLYENLLRDHPGSEKLTDEGKANKSARMLLQDYFYDAASTSALDLPGGTDGAAFRHRTTNEVRFMLWAKTHTDEQENSQAYYSFPTSLVNKQLDVYKWDYCVTNAKAATVQPAGILLTGEPVILVRTNLDATNNPLQQRPVANAGRDTAINIPYVTLNGSAWHPAGRPMQYYWDMISMSGSLAEYPSFKNRTSTAVTLIGLKKGVYAFRFTARDDQGAFAADTVLVAVDTSVSFINNLPIAYAGSDTIVYMPQPQLTLSSAGSADPDGVIMHYRWTKIAGPGPGMIMNPSSPSSEVTGLVVGDYAFELEVTDNQGASSTDIVNVSVSSVLKPNKLPVARAGKDTSINYPVSSLSLSAYGSYDPDGTITSYQWKQLSGPSAATIINASSVTPVLRGFQRGIYVFGLTVRDNAGGSAVATVKVAVHGNSMTFLTGRSVINIYPANDMMYPLEICLFDVTGKLLQRQKLVKQSLTRPFAMDVARLMEGVYVVQMRDASGKNVSQKFFKQ